MLFNPENKRYFEITPEEKQLLLLSGGNFNSVIKQRKAKFGEVEPIRDDEKIGEEMDVRTNKPNVIKQPMVRTNSINLIVNKNLRDG